MSKVKMKLLVFVQMLSAQCLKTLLLIVTKSDEEVAPIRLMISYKFQVMLWKVKVNPLFFTPCIKLWSRSNYKLQTIGMQCLKIAFFASKQTEKTLISI